MQSIQSFRVNVMTKGTWNSASIEAERLLIASQVIPRFLRVLVVDDDADTTDSLTILLRLWGHDVRSAYNGETALRMAVTIEPDVVLLDVAMPTMTGYEVAHRLKRSLVFKQTRLIAVSGYADEAHQSRCREAGFDEFLPKPLEFANLKRMLLAESQRRSRGCEPLTTEPVTMANRDHSSDLPAGAMPHWHKNRILICPLNSVGATAS